MSLYIVRTSFKSGGKLYEAGSLIEDLSSIKLFKVRLNEGKLIPVPERKEDLENLHSYFKIRMGKDLKKDLADRVPRAQEARQPVASKPPTPGTPKPLTGTKPATKPATKPVTPKTGE